MANWLERLRQNFLWGGLGDEYKSYLGKGIRYALLLRMGFGGVRKLGSFNQALLSKWLWHFGVEGNYLWRWMVGVKYGEYWGQ